MSNYPFRFKIGDGVKVSADCFKVGNEAGTIHALELSAHKVIAVVKTYGVNSRLIRVAESQLTRE